MNYRRFTSGLVDKGILIPENEDPSKYIKNKNKDYYLSVYKFNDQHYQTYLKQGNSVAGITDVVTNQLWWDFDNEANLEEARKDTVALCDKLLSHGISKDNLKICFSGKKGFSVEVNVDSPLTPEDVRAICKEMAPNLDTTMYNATRIFRLPFTKHHTSGLYKIPLTYDILKDVPIEDIKTEAKERSDMSFYDKEDLEQFKWGIVKLPSSILKLKDKKPLTKKIIQNKDITDKLDFTDKPKWMSNCRWALQKGHFTEGSRNTGFLILAATYKNQGFTQEMNWGMLKGVAEHQATVNDSDAYNEKDLWINIITTVYKESWRNGQYSCREEGNWLYDYCQALGEHKCEHKENEGLLEVNEVFSTFQNYAENIEKNTIITGIKSLDSSIRFRAGQMVGLLGAPSSGKSSLALELLENTSRQGIPALFYSLDMADSELFQKIIQRVTGYDEAKIYQIFKDKNPERELILKKVEEAYKNVKFCFDTGVSVEKIDAAVQDYEANRGEKVKLLLIDYNELLSGPHSDATANSGHVAGELKKLTNLRGTCTIVLLQPAKVWGDASDEIDSYRATKGSSLLEQCFSIILGIYRPGFSAKNNSADDKFMVMSALKNRMGKLFRLSFTWNGIRGKIDEMDDSDYDSLKELLERRQAEKSAKSDKAWG